MKLLGETNCLVFELTPMEIESYFEKFGEEWWNDTDDIICIPTKNINNEYLKSKYTMFFGQDVTTAQFVIIEVKEI